jgi:hypothetical protein
MITDYTDGHGYGVGSMPALALGVRKSGGELGSTMDGAENV